MTVKKCRIRTLDRYIGFIQGDDIIVGMANPTDDDLKKIGFIDLSNNGDTVLPSRLGPVSTFNAEGKEEIHRDQAMETEYRTVDWHWSEWHGNERVEQSKFVDVPYQRYPRSFIAPPAIELTLTTDGNGNRVVVSPIIKKWKSQKQELIHTINLFLEIFGECSFYGTDMTQFMKAPIRKLNWKILPPGKRPWDSLKNEIQPVLESVPGGKKVVVEHRLESINSHNPEFAAVGEAGFNGYVILGFPAKNLYVLESLFYGNATYVFGEQWEKLSKMTKAEILNDKLQKGRVIHREGWEDNINRWLAS